MYKSSSQKKTGATAVKPLAHMPFLDDCWNWTELNEEDELGLIDEQRF